MLNCDEELDNFGCTPNNLCSIPNTIVQLPFVVLAIPPKSQYKILTDDTSRCIVVASIEAPRICDDNSVLSELGLLEDQQDTNVISAFENDETAVDYSKSPGIMSEFNFVMPAGQGLFDNGGNRGADKVYDSIFKPPVSKPELTPIQNLISPFKENMRSPFTPMPADLSPYLS